jgi:hypothetical protein
MSASLRVATLQVLNIVNLRAEATWRSLVRRCLLLILRSCCRLLLLISWSCCQWSLLLLWSGCRWCFCTLWATARLKVKVEQLEAEVQQLRVQQQPEVIGTCEVCYAPITSTADSYISCPSDHFVCHSCTPGTVESFLDRVGESDTLLEEYRARGGGIPCVRHNPAFKPSCQATYSDRMLARNLHDEIFSRYRKLQDEIVAIRACQEQNERIQRYQEEATIEYLRQHHPNARMCPRCLTGPVINENCNNLRTHNGQASGRTFISNACRSCGFFTDDWTQWLPWDGVVRAEASHRRQSRSRATPR